MKIATMALAAMVLTTTAFAGPPIPSSIVRPNGIHPEAHGPMLRSPDPVRRVATLVNGRWRMTRAHVTTCKRHYKSYNPRTDRYHAYSGAYRRCVL